MNDQPLFSRGLEILLPAITGSRVVIAATTTDGSLASGLVRRLQPDLALVDLGIPDPGGLRTIRAIRRAEPQIPVVAMSDRPDAPRSSDGSCCEPSTAEAIEALQAGAVGYLSKTAEPETLVQPLLAAVEGWAVVPPAVLSVMGAVRQEDSAPQLTAEERRLWRLIAAGRTVEEIARVLHVSDRTAKRCIAALLRRLQVRTRIEAATLAGRLGLLDDPAPTSGLGTHPRGT